MSKKNKILAAADKYISQQKYEKALNELLSVVKMTPNDTNLLNKVGDLYSLTGNKKSAISYFEKVAQGYHRSGFYPKAIAVYKKINRLDGDYMDAREKLVELYLQQGHQSEAKAELRRMAEVYTSGNLPGRALDVYHKLVEIEPNNIDIRIKLTELLIREGKQEEASEHFLSMGHDLIEKNMINEARKILGQAGKFSPDNTKIQVLMAKATIAEGNLDDAVKQLTEICEKVPHDLEAVVTLGEAYLSKNMPSYAKTCFLRAVHISADHIQPLEDVAKLFIENGELDEAFEALEPVCESLMGRNEMEEATRLYRAILYVDETHEPSLLKLIEMYKKTNQTSNAILTYEKMINHAMAKNQGDKAQTFISSLLELDPDNLEWRAKMDSLSGLTAEDALGLSADSVAEMSASLSSSMPSNEDSEAEIFSIDSPEHGSLEPDDPETVVQNHLTEADVFIKYGIMDQALTHLIAIIDIDPKHFEANVRLKQIYLERKEIDKSVACLTNLATICMDQGKLGDAEDFLEEAESYKPGVARIYKGRLESLRSADMQQHLEDQSQHGFDIELAEGFNASSGELVFNDVAPEDVVDFGALEANKNDLDEDDGAWSLDMPQSNADQGVSFAFDVSDGNNDEILGQEIHVDANDDSIRFFEAVDETEMLEEPDEDSFAIPSIDDSSPDIDNDDLELPQLDSLSDDDLGDIDELIGDEEPDLAAEFRAEFGLDAGSEAEEPELQPEVKVEINFDDLMNDEELNDLDLVGEDDLLVSDHMLAADVDEDDIQIVGLDEDELGSLADMQVDEPEVITPEQPPPVPPELPSAEPPPVELPPVEKTPAQPSPVDPVVESQPVNAPATADLDEVPMTHLDEQTQLSDEDRVALDNELEEIDFFLSMEAYEDATNLLEEALRKFGEVGDLMERKETIQKLAAADGSGVGSQAPAANESAGILDTGGFFDLAAELKDELFDESSEVTDNAAPEEIQSVEELFEEFKKGVAEQIDDDDFETHYDLGIAYKEMGLLEESMAEFKKALGDKNRFMECTAMVGACLVELGRSEDAVAHYSTALEHDFIRASDKLAIKYELALVFEGLGELEKALDLFQAIKAENPGYRDTAGHIEALV